MAHFVRFVSVCTRTRHTCAAVRQMAVGVHNRATVVHTVLRHVQLSTGHTYVAGMDHQRLCVHVGRGGAGREQRSRVQFGNDVRTTVGCVRLSGLGD